MLASCYNTAMQLAEETSSFNIYDRNEEIMNIEEFRQYCLSLPGTTEKMPFQKFNAGKSVLVFYVCGKMYCLIDIDKFDNCIVKCQPERIEELKAQYDGIINPHHMSHRYWIGITFDSDINDTLMKQLIMNSHDIVKK